MVLSGICFTDLIILEGGGGNGAALKLVPSCLQIKAAKQESQIGIPILLRSHAQQQEKAKWVQCKGKKDHYRAKILKHC